MKLYYQYRFDVLRIFLLFVILQFVACSDPQVHAQLEETQKELEAAQQKIKTLQQPPQMAGFIHTVFFWLKDDLSDVEIADFEEGLKSLSEVKAVEAFHYGAPAGTPRSVVDNSYDMALILHFADQEAQDTYQVDDIHDAFVQNHQDKWTRVQVYDTLLK